MKLKQREVGKNTRPSERNAIVGKKDGINDRSIDDP